MDVLEECQLRFSGDHGIVFFNCCYSIHNDAVPPGILLRFVKLISQEACVLVAIAIYGSELLSFVIS